MDKPVNFFRFSNIGISAILAIIFAYAGFNLIKANFPLNLNGGEAVPFVLLMLFFIIFAISLCVYILLSSARSKFSFEYGRKIFFFLVFILIIYSSFFLY